MIKQFEIDPNSGIEGLDFTGQNHEANSAKLREILSWCEENLHETMHTVNSSIMAKLLEISVVQGKYDFDLFRKYLKKPIQLASNLFDFKYTKKFKKGGTEVHHYESTLVNHLKLELFQHFTINQIFDEYVKEYFRIEGSDENSTCKIDIEKNVYGEFDRIIHGSILKKHYFNTQVLLGKSPEGLMDFLTENKVYEIKESKRLFFTVETITTSPMGNRSASNLNSRISQIL